MNKSYWDHVTMPHYFAPAKADRFDVVIVGGGMTGLCAAHFLKQAGKKVCVLERNRIASGDTYLTTAHLTYVTDTRLRELVKTFGEDAAQLIWRGGEVAMRALEKIATDLRIRCQFERVPGYLHSPFEGEEDETDELKEEAALAKRLEFDAEFVAATPAVHRPGIEFRGQARFHPLKFLAGLASAIDGGGSCIYEHAEVTEVINDPLAVLCNGNRIECDFLVIATHVPLMGKSSLIEASLLQTRLVGYSSYAIDSRIPRGTMPDALYWDTTKPYHYMRLNPGAKYDYVILGGEDHKTGQVDDTPERFERLEKLLRQLVPEAKVDRRWSGQVIETHDGLPLIGETSNRQFIATGFAGNGMTFGCLGGLMACDALLGHKNPWQEIFDVHRTNLRTGVWDYVRENADYPYYMVADRLASAEATSPDEIGSREGKVLIVNGQRVACSRDAYGKLSAVSAICTHMDCVVHWNKAECTWDCPCHGSRFKPTGEVLAGPAETPLDSVSLEDMQSESHAHN